MTTVKKILRKARRIPSKQKPVKPANPYKIAAMHQKRWRQTVDNVRDRHFKTAQYARAQQVEAINAEKQRQVDIQKNRIKNLKKARKVLAKTRSSQ